MALFAAGRAVRVVYVFHRDLGCVIQPQGQFVTAQFHLDGIAHGGDFAQGHFGAGGKAHVQQVVAQFPCAAYRANQGVLPDFQFR